MGKKRILVIEDYEGIQSLFALQCERAGLEEPLQARTLADAVRLHQENPSVDAILFCGKLANDETTYEGDSPGTIRWFALNGYKGRMFGSSGDPSLFEAMNVAGCEHSAPKGKIIEDIVKRLS